MGEQELRSVGVEGDPFNRSSKRGARYGADRLPGRRGDRPFKQFVGDARSNSPRTLRKAQLHDPEPTSFTAYVAGIREARNDLKPDEWPRLESYPAGKFSIGKQLGGMPLAASGTMKSKTPEKRISGSQSLPALPAKGRGLL